MKKKMNPIKCDNCGREVVNENEYIIVPKRENSNIEMVLCNKCGIIIRGVSEERMEKFTKQKHKKEKEWDNIFEQHMGIFEPSQREMEQMEKKIRGGERNEKKSI